MAIEPVTREERFLAAAGGQSVTTPTPITRKEQLLQGIIDAVKSGGATPDVIEGVVNDYLEANPVKPGATTEQAAQIEQNTNNIPKKADLNGTTATFRNSAGVALFTLDLSGLGGSAAVYGNLVLSAEELTITEGQSGSFTVALDKAPSANQPVYLAVSDGSRLSVEPAVLTFTPDNWETPQTVTVTSLEDDDEEDNAVTVTLTSTAVDARQVAVAIRDNDVQLEIVTDGLILFADYTDWDGVSDTIVDKAGGVTLKDMTNWTKVQNGIKAKDGVQYKAISIVTEDDLYAAFVEGFNSDELTIEWFANYHIDQFSVNRLNPTNLENFQGAALLKNQQANGAMCNELGTSHNFISCRPYLDTTGAYQFVYKQTNTRTDVPHYADFCHVVTVFCKDGSIKTYHNGVLAGEVTYADFGSWIPVDASGAYVRSVINITNMGSPTTAAHNASAWLASQRVYSRALTQDEIVQNMNAEGQRLGLTDFI